MPSDLFHPVVAAWLERRFGAPTEPQAHAWPSIAARRHTLIAAPTGSGKTLAAFLSAIDALVREAMEAPLPDETRVVYVSPLKALSNDIQRNLEEPLAGIRAELLARGLPDAPIRTLVRTGDTPSSERTAMTKKPPHILVTTPESLFILLTSEGGRRMLKTVRTVIVDEIHAVADDKRGSHLALSLERLADLVERNGGSLARIGLSATQRPIELVARFLVGEGRDGERPDCEIVDVGHRRRLDVGVEVPASSPLETVMSNEVWEEVYDRIADLVRAHRTTLVFVNTRRLAERATRHLAERLGEERVATHHGSLSKEQRLESERRLKAGELDALVATASLELGIDIGAVDLVCQIGSTRSIATFLQRVGRAGHWHGGLPKGRLFPLTRDELVEAAALLDAVRCGELDRLIIPERALDILAQHLVAMVAAEEWTEDELFDLVRRAWPYRDLARKDFDEVLAMLAQGFTTRWGRRGAYLHHDAVNGRLRARRGARLAAVTSGGAIPDTADFDVVLEPSGTVIGTLNEDFAVESLAGDVFQLGNASWRILRVEPGRVRVEDARGAPPTIPFWLGEAPARTPELSEAVVRLRAEVATRAAAAGGGRAGVAAAMEWLVDEVGLLPAAAVQVAEYLGIAAAALGTMPTQETIVAERFFDEAGDMHLVVHAPFGSRLNRAWGLALRKRFCQTFNFELQAAATENAIVLSLGPTHSFPVEDVFRFLHSRTVRGVLTQAMLDSPMFGVRWRWNAGRSLALLRFAGGKRVPPRLQRQQAEDLIAVVFPDQLACLENIVGEREIPDHPLVAQTVRDCLEEAMDIEGLERLLARMERGELTLVARDVTEPSPLAHEVINAQPYAFLDDAPLEERRTQAIRARRWLDVETAGDLGALDAAAIERVRSEAWPDAETPDELHDALLSLGYATAEEGRRSGWEAHLAALAAERRATVLVPVGAGRELWMTAERLPQLLAVHPGASCEPEVVPPARQNRAWDRDEALVELVRGRLSGLGPTTAAAHAEGLGVAPGDVERALLALEGEGFVFRGRFTPGLGTDVVEWCERRLLARIHRATLDRLRQEIEPVGRADFVRFLAAWQRVGTEERAEGPEGLAAVLEQLEGFEAPAAAWEGEILPARLAEHDPAWLDALCLAGRWAWARVTTPAGEGRRSGPVKATPIALLARHNLAVWQEIGAGAAPANPADADLSSAARAVRDHLARRGASFFHELAAGAGLLHTQAEEALGELVAAGLVTADSFTGLRALLVPSSKRPPVPATLGAGETRGRRRGDGAVFGIEHAGRWSLLAHEPATERTDGLAASPEAIETVAWTLLRRYGVVFRKLLERESLLPPWRDLLRVLRRLEARGEIRGGRFVEGFSGEQYALPEAIGRLRAIRRTAGGGALVSVSAADPLNLVGILTPGERVTALAGNRVLYRDGVPIAVYEAKRVRFLVDLDAASRWQAEGTLVRRTVPPRLRAYLGRSA